MTVSFSELAVIFNVHLMFIVCSINDDVVFYTKSLVYTGNFIGYAGKEKWYGKYFNCR